MLGLGFTGYLLPWDMKALFATKVGIQIAEQTPLIILILKHYSLVIPKLLALKH